MRLATQTFLGLLCFISSSQAGDYIPHFGKAPRRCSVPGYDYQRNRFSLPNDAETFTAVLIESQIPNPVISSVSSQAPADTFAFRFFQVAQPRIIVNHCAIARIGVTLGKDGRCIVNLRADQSPPYIPLDILEPAARFKRNRFIVTVRGYGFFPLRNDAERVLRTELGQPELFRMQYAFWVERGQSVEQRLEGNPGQIPLVPVGGNCARTVIPMTTQIPFQEIYRRVNRMEVELRIE